MEHVYFVERGLVSVSAKTGSDQSVEVWLIGSEGMTGIPILLGDDAHPPHRRVVQVGGTALKITAPEFRRVLEDFPKFRKLLLKYVQAVLVQTSQSGACNLQHALKQRLARWLFIAQEGLESKTLPLTHEVLSRLLGVRRASVTECLASLHHEGAIELGRSSIQIRNFAQLESASCGCHRLIRGEYQRLLGN
jgi:CRP-like cAMP-binding protein